MRERAASERRLKEQVSKRAKEEERKRSTHSVAVVSAAEARGAVAGADEDVDEEEDDDGYDDDDFDNYDDDFADEEEIEREEKAMNAIKMQMEAENKRALQKPQSQKQRQAVANPSPRGNYDGGAARTNAPAAGESKTKQRPVVAPRKFVPVQTKKEKASAEDMKYIVARNNRARKILEQVSLSEEAFNLFELQPVTKHERFMREMGLGLVRSIGNQYNEDWIQTGTQTEEQHTFDAETQFPDGNGNVISGSAARLQKFIGSAAQVVETLMEENEQLLGYADDEGSSSNPFASATVDLLLPANFGKRRVVDMAYSEARAEVVLVAYTPAEPVDGLAVEAEKGLLCVWDSKQPRAPVKVLVVDGSPTCCALPSDRGHIAFAGMAEGSLALWDLREPSSQHQMVEQKDGSNFCVRSPTFTTNSLFHDNHESPVKSIVAVGQGRGQAQGPSESGFDIMTMGSSRNTFPIASVDEVGGVMMWTVMELKEGDVAGSEIDLGLGISGRVKLMRSGVIQDAGTVHATHMCINPDDSSEFLVALTSGGIARHRRFGGKPSPPSYALPDSLAFHDSCTAIAFCPSATDIFLAGFESGTMAFFSTLHSEPVLTWFNVSENGVKALAWSTFRPAVIFVLDGKGKLLLWDLLQNDQQPSQRVEVGDSATVAVSNMIDPYGPSYLALQSGADAGAVQIHTLKPFLSEELENEETMFRELIEHLC